jgi:hypothetical protein
VPSPGNISLSAQWVFDRKGARRDVVKAYTESRCNAEIAIKALGMSRATFYRWLKEDAQLAAALDRCSHEHREAKKRGEA